MILNYTKDFVVQKCLSLSLELFHFQLYRFLLQGLKNLSGTLLQNCLGQEVQKSTNYSDKLI